MVNIMTIGLLMKLWAILASLYHIYVAVFGTPIAMIHRPLHLFFAMVLVFYLYNSKGEKKESLNFIDLLWTIVVVIVFSYTLYKSDWIVTRFFGVTDLTALELTIGVLMIIAILEGTRRVLGKVLPIFCIIVIIYALFGHLIPGILGHRSINLGDFVEVSYYSLDGIFGSPMHAVSNYVFLFIIFGQLFLDTGVRNILRKIAIGLTRLTVGGAAKGAVVASALFGMVSGASSANVVTTGSFTIPLMKSMNYPPIYAAAVEAVASTGGQIMPPVMGAAAFIMMQITGISYLKIMTYAIFPAIMYFLSVFIMVHFRSSKMETDTLESKKKIVEEETTDLSYKDLILVIPLIAIVYALIQGFSPQRAGFYAIISSMVILLIKLGFNNAIKAIIEDLEKSARAVITISLACATAGIVVGIVNLTGLSAKISFIVSAFSGGVPLIALLLSMIVAIVLGMGLPTSAAYVIMGVLVAPALIKVGFIVPVAHFFIFYFACISAITPPVCTASYAAAAIADTNPIPTGFYSMKLGFAGFIVPFIFAFNPAFLLIGNIVDILIVVLTAPIALIAIAASLEGYFVNVINNKKVRVLLFLLGICIIFPNNYLKLFFSIIILGYYILSKRSLTIKDKKH